jgi:hypothetical protein
MEDISIYCFVDMITPHCWPADYYVNAYLDELYIHSLLWWRIFSRLNFFKSVQNRVKTIYILAYISLYNITEIESFERIKKHKPTYIIFYNLYEYEIQISIILVFLTPSLNN